MKSMNAVERFRAAMRKLGYTDRQIQDAIMTQAGYVRAQRRRELMDNLLDACNEMTDDELKALEGGEI